MSRWLSVSAIDIDRLRAIWGVNDQAVLSSILSQNATRIAQHDAYFHHLPGIAVYQPLADALAQIIQGQTDPTFSPLFQFEHAAGLVADTLGEPLEADLFQECSPSFWDEVDKVIDSALRRAQAQADAWPALASILKRGPCFDIPLDPVWPLGSGFLEASEVLGAAKAAEASDLKSLGDELAELRWPDDAIDAAEQYHQWLSHAAGQGLGLYFHG